MAFSSCEPLKFIMGCSADENVKNVELARGVTCRLSHKDEEQGIE